MTSSDQNLPTMESIMKTVREIMELPNQNPPTWESVASRMPLLLSDLKSDRLRNRGTLGNLPEQGIYVFHLDIPVYVGRTDRMSQRILEHGRPSAGHNSATLAFAMAVRWARKNNLDIDGVSRNDLQRNPEFTTYFDTTKRLVSNMGIRVVEVTDPIEQAVFEVYAALELRTTLQHGGFNDFANH